MIRQAREQGYSPQLVSGDALVTDEYWKITGEAGEGTLMTFQPDPRAKPEAVALVERFRADNYEPEGYTLYTYAAVQAWAQAAETAGTADPDTVIKTLRKLRLQTVIGTFHFKPNGDVNLPPYGIYHWTNGAFEQLGVIK